MLLSLEEELNSCLVIFEVFGLQYFSLKRLSYEGFKNHRKVHRFIYMLFLLDFVNSLSILFIANEHEIIKVKDKINAKNVFMFAIQHTMDVGILLIVCASLIQSFFSTHKTKKIFMNTKEIVQLSIKEFKMTIDIREMKRTAWKRLAAMVIFILAAHGTLMIVNIECSEIILRSFFGLIPLFFLEIVVFKFVFYVGMVNNLLEFLGTLLEKVFTNEPIRIIDNINFHLSVKPTKPPEDPIKKLRVVWKIYNQIYECGTLVNDSLGLTILIVLTSLVVTLTVSGYDIFVILIGGIAMSKFAETIYVLVVTNFILFTIVNYCQKTKRIMSELAMNLKRLECENYEKLRSETRDFLRSFYLQLIHQPVIFTAFGMYAINMTLIASIVTEIVSYQIILVQFYAS